MRKNIFICIIFAVSISACTEELDKEINIETNSSLYDWHLYTTQHLAVCHNLIFMRVSFSDTLYFICKFRNVFSF